MNLQIIENYSDRSFVVTGETKPIKDQLKEFGGRFNPFLKHNGSTIVGWVFSVTRLTQLREFIKGLVVAPTPGAPVRFIEKVMITQPVKVLNNGKITHVPVAGKNVIRVITTTMGATAFTPPKKTNNREKPFVAVFEGFVNGEYTFTSTKKLQDFMKSVNNTRKSEKISVTFK
jgi:hypothetical protein